MRSIEGEGYRVASLYQLTCRPDHPHPRALRALDLSRAQRERG